MLVAELTQCGIIRTSSLHSRQESLRPGSRPISRNSSKRWPSARGDDHGKSSSSRPCPNALPPPTSPRSSRSRAPNYNRRSNLSHLDIEDIMELKGGPTESDTSESASEEEERYVLPLAQAEPTLQQQPSYVYVDLKRLRRMLDRKGAETPSVPICAHVGPTVVNTITATARSSGRAKGNIHPGGISGPMNAQLEPGGIRQRALLLQSQLSGAVVQTMLASATAVYGQNQFAAEASCPSNLDVQCRTDQRAQQARLTRRPKTADGRVSPTGAPHCYVNIGNDCRISSLNKTPSQVVATSRRDCVLAPSVPITPAMVTKTTPESESSEGKI